MKVPSFFATVFLVFACTLTQTASANQIATFPAADTNQYIEAAETSHEELPKASKTSTEPDTSDQVQKSAKPIVERKKLARLDAFIPNALSASLQEGTAFLSSKKPILLHTQVADVLVAPDAVAYAIVSQGNLTVYDLTESDDTDITVRLRNNEILPVMIGHQLLLSPDMDASFEAANPAPSIAYDNVSNNGIHCGYRLYDAQFTICSLLDQAPEFAQLSRTKADDLKLESRIFKTIAIFQSESA